jgi:hypothetical protein
MRKEEWLKKLRWPWGVLLVAFALSSLLGSPCFAQGEGFYVTAGSASFPSSNANCSRTDNEILPDILRKTTAVGCTDDPALGGAVFVLPGFKPAATSFIGLEIFYTTSGTGVCAWTVLPIVQRDASAHLIYGSASSISVPSPSRAHTLSNRYVTLQGGGLAWDALINGACTGTCGSGTFPIDLVVGFDTTTSTVGLGVKCHLLGIRLIKIS